MFRYILLSICMCFFVFPVSFCDATIGLKGDAFKLHADRRLSRYSPTSASTKWQSHGILGRYCGRSTEAVRQKLKSFSYSPVPTDSLIGFCKAHFVLSLNIMHYWSLPLDSSRLSEQLGLIWQKNATTIQSTVKEITEEQAQKMAFVTVTDTTWSECIGACRSVATEGPFSHKYSLEDALMILHMYPQIGFFEKYWIPSEDMEFYTNCVAGALNSLMDIPEACVLFNRREPYPSVDIFRGVSPT